jgi:hypothetical protein
MTRIPTPDQATAIFRLLGFVVVISICTGLAVGYFLGRI